MNTTIHELINMKARKIEVEIELGISDVDIRHLSSKQIKRIDQDLEHHYDPRVMLEMIETTIRTDEQIIANRH
ncbi:MAG: hypothetical protein JEZ08_10575 [Clostridiales bacterium]|nr:hypothetical protein [Clostridiales bacterium]